MFASHNAMRIDCKVILIYTVPTRGRKQSCTNLAATETNIVEQINGNKENDFTTHRCIAQLHYLNEHGLPVLDEMKFYPNAARAFVVVINEMELPLVNAVSQVS